LLSSGRRRTRSCCDWGSDVWSSDLILDQDTDNLYAQQEGLETSAKAGITLGDYQEIRIRHFERAIDRYVAMPPLVPGNAVKR